LYIDADHTLDLRRAEQVGVCTDALIAVRIGKASVAGSAVIAAAKLGADLIALDTGSALRYREEIGPYTLLHPGTWPSRQAADFTSFYNRLAAAIGKTRAAVIVLSQVRAREHATVSRREVLVPAAPRALSALASLQLQLRHIGCGRISVDLLGSKIGPSMLSTEIRITPAGIDFSGKIDATPDDAVHPFVTGRKDIHREWLRSDGALWGEWPNEWEKVRQALTRAHNALSPPEQRVPEAKRSVNSG
jgi:hypothetical protein